MKRKISIKYLKDIIKKLEELDEGLYNADIEYHGEHYLIKDFKREEMEHDVFYIETGKLYRQDYDRFGEPEYMCVELQCSLAINSDFSRKFFKIIAYEFKMVEERIYYNRIL